MILYKKSKLVYFLMHAGKGKAKGEAFDWLQSYTVDFLMRFEFKFIHFSLKMVLNCEG